MIWGNKYVMGVTTGFVSCLTGLGIGGVTGLLAAAAVLSLSAMWYHAGKGETG